VHTAGDRTDRFNSQICTACVILATVDINKMLVELRAERENIEQAIMVLQRMAAGRGKRRGRPPAWMSAGIAPIKRRGRPPGSKNKPKAA